MPGKDKLEFDVLANDKASGVMDKVANAGKDVGQTLDRSADKGAAALKKLSSAGKDAGESLSKVGDKAKEGMGKLSEGLKAGPLAWIGLGAGIGALVMDGFTQAMDNQDANALLTAQLGASNADMTRLGKISGDLYKNAFGDSVAEVDQVLKTVFQSGLASLSDSEDKIKGVTTQVMNYSKITGEEALPVTRAVSQMLRTGLAKNATEAFDLLTRGAQKGLDKSEDLLDTVNEYGTQFRKVGLTGQQAFGLISQAIAAGARDSDIAADAIKEFSIRAVDGSTQTAAGFKGLGLNAKVMADTIAEGGPRAAAALDLTLDRLRAVKDPAKQAQLATMLFGTQAEDLGKALYAMNLDTAAKEFGTVAGAAERAGDVINNTTSNKLATVGRTIQMSVVDAIGKYALPKLEQLADWFNGPGKMVIAGWALGGAQALIDFADAALGALQATLGGLTNFAAQVLLSSSHMIRAINPGKSKELREQAEALKDFGKATDGLDSAREALSKFSTTLGKANTKVKLEANIEGLEQKLAKAQAELRDPGLTKERRAKLTADIARLTKARDEALRKLGDPNLIKTRTAKLAADKRDLDAKIASARKQLADPRLTATKRAKLQAEIAQLLRQKAAAQAAINSLTGKTVVISAVARINAAAIRNKVDQQLARYELRAGGGPVRKGQAYVVGEKRPELFVPEQDGMIIPEIPPNGSSKAYGSVAYAGGGSMVTLSFDDSEMGRFMLRMMRKALANSGNSGNVQLALAGRPA